MKKTTIYSLLTIFWLFLVVLSAHALDEVGSQGGTQQTDPKRMVGATDSAKRAPPTAEKCARMTKRIDQRINKYNSNADHTRLMRLQTRLSEVITKFKAKGFDTSQLEADLATLKTKTDVCRVAYGQFIAKLALTKNFVCGDTQGQFRAALRDSRVEMAAAQVPCKDARSFMDKVVIPDLRAFRQKVRADRQLTPKPTKTSPSTTPSL